MPKLKVFIDSNVIAAYLAGQSSLRNLFSAPVLEKIQYAINPVVLQELLLINRQLEQNLGLDDLAQVVEILDVRPNVDIEFVRRIKQLRNNAIHANDILILESASSCDYLVTFDRDLIQTGEKIGLIVLTPEEFLKQFEVRQ